MDPSSNHVIVICGWPPPLLPPYLINRRFWHLLFSPSSTTSTAFYTTPPPSHLLNTFCGFYDDLTLTPQHITSTLLAFPLNFNPKKHLRSTRVSPKMLLILGRNQYLNLNCCFSPFLPILESQNYLKDFAQSNKRQDTAGGAIFIWRHPFKSK